MRMLGEDEEDRILDLFEKHGVSLYLCGHSHNPKVRSSDGVCQIIAGCLKKDWKDAGINFFEGNLDENYNRVSFVAHKWDSNKWAIDNHFSLKPPFKKDGFVSLITPPPITVKKIAYKAPKNYIPRNLNEYNFDAKNESPLFLDRGNLYDICLKKKHIIIIAAAGVGKSTDMVQLAHMLNHEMSKDIYPILIPIKDFLDSVEIETYIPENYRQVSHEKLYLLFDGYDEIKDSHRDNFVSKINNFARNNPQINIVISTRGNFYRNIHERNGEPGIFDGFSEYAIFQFTNEEVINYIDKQVNDVDVFIELSRQKNIYDLLNTPFYLIHAVELYKEDSSLPFKNDLMENLINLRFCKDSNRTSSSESLNEMKFEIFSLFQKLAISMQRMGRFYLTDDEYQEITQPIQRNRLKLNGIWKKEGSNWQFSHANFQEYLAAKYLSRLSVEKILKDIKTTNNALNSRWVNTVAFLIPMVDDKTLLDWIIDTSPILITNIEKDKLLETERDEIFKKIMNNNKEKNIWLPFYGEDISKLARFFASEKTLEFLTNEINNPAHFRAQSASILTLSAFKNLFGKETDVANCLISCCENEATRPHERKYAIIAIGKLRLDSKEITARLFALLKNSTASDEISGMCSYLIETKQVDEYIDFFIAALNNKRDEYYISMSLRVRDAFKQINTPSAIKKVLEYMFLDDDNALYTYKPDEVSGQVLEIAANVYNSGETELYQYVLDVFMHILKSYESKSIKMVWNFFRNTGTWKQAIGHILSSSETINRAFQFAKLADSEYARQFTVLYKEGIRQEEFIRFAESLYENDPLFDICDAAVKDISGDIITPRKQINHNELEEQGEQRYFDSLFSVSSYRELANELLATVGGLNTTFNQLFDFRKYYEHNRREFNVMRWDLLRLNDDKQSDESINAQLDSIKDWDTFLMYRICKQLESNKSINVSDSQKEYLQNYCNENFKDFSFAESVKYTDKGWEYSWTSYFLSFLIQYFNKDFHCDEQNLRELLVYPHAYEFNSGNFIASRERASYVEGKLSKKQLIEQVKINISDSNLSKHVYERHLFLCKKYKISEVKDFATNICKKPDLDIFIKRDAVDCLFEVVGLNYVVENILDIDDDELLEHIARKCMDSCDGRIASRLIGANNKSNDRTKFLAQLIYYQTLEGLDIYYEVAKSKNTIPDYSDEGSSFNHITEAISYVRESELLPALEKILSLRLSPNFKDADIFGLYHSLSTAFKNVANNGDTSRVIFIMQSLIDKNKDNYELIFFCNNIIEELKHHESVNNSDTWNIGNVAKFLTP
ncbi:MAG: hypothetical protein FWF81_07240 [Defluviitaleaceae bacterium]|nr:hypothetical protein [Defluviitaleaceae bacterium]